MIDPPPLRDIGFETKGGSITLSGFADFGSFFSPAADQKISPAAGSGQSLFHFFASGGQSLFHKKIRLRRAPGNHFSIFRLRRSITFPKNSRLRRALGNHISIFSPPAVNHFSKKIACGELRSITFSFFHIRGQSLFQKKSPSAASVNHFSIFSPPASFRPLTFHFSPSAVNHFSKKIASGGFSVNHFSVFSPPADFQLSIFKV